MESGGGSSGSKSRCRGSNAAFPLTQEGTQARRDLMTGQSRPPSTGTAEASGSQAHSLEVGLKSDTGPSRDLNEDYIGYTVPSDEEQRRLKGSLFVVADGMGGYLAGEVASREAVTRVMEAYYADPAPDPGESLGRAVRSANRLLHEHASSDSTKGGMGTTLVAAAIIGSDVYIANVGDSRAYGINRDTITQITRDHSWVEEQIQAGILTRDKAREHPQRNLITRALGRRENVEVDLFEGKLLPGDALLLCTDGVCGPLTDPQMAQAVRSLPPSPAAAQLVGLAEAQGGTDNASALIVRAIDPNARSEVGAQPSGQIQIPVVQKRRHWVLGLGVVCAILCLIMAAVFVPALFQKLAGDPVAAPIPAPLQDGRLGGSSLDQVAIYLGYADSDQMVTAHGGMLAAGSIGTSNLMPATAGVYLVGTAQDWDCAQQECTFHLTMAGTDYTVTYRAPGEQGVDLNGRPVRVYGPQQENQPAVAAQLIEQGSQWWAWWQTAWELVHQAGSLDQVTWVYSIVDQNPNGLLDLDRVPGLQRGDPLLLRGLWRDDQPLSFDQDQIYRLQGSTYVPLTEQPALPLPTVTLQPTSTLLLDQQPGIESARATK